jgi:hypothetical protein
MPTITIRVSGQERAALEAAASRSGQNLSAYIRETLMLREGDIAGRVEDLDRRLSELERLAHG